MRPRHGEVWANAYLALRALQYRAPIKNWPPLPTRAQCDTHRQNFRIGTIGTIHTAAGHVGLADFFLVLRISYCFNPLTHGLFEVHYLRACGLNSPQIYGRICPQPWEMACLKRNQGGERLRRGESCFSYWPSPPRSVWHTQKPVKIGTVSQTAWLFGPEDLVKTRFVTINCKKTMDRAF
jgi:hypothetical protein